jgi:hypothetical protein
MRRKDPPFFLAFPFIRQDFYGEKLSSIGLEES